MFIFGKNEYTIMFNLVVTSPNRGICLYFEDVLDLAVDRPGRGRVGHHSRPHDQAGAQVKPNCRT